MEPIHESAKEATQGYDDEGCSKHVCFHFSFGIILVKMYSIHHSFVI